MSDEFLGDRKKALEESFFARENRKLLDRLRVEREKRAARRGLKELSGIEDLAARRRQIILSLNASLAARLVPRLRRRASRGAPSRPPGPGGGGLR